MPIVPELQQTNPYLAEVEGFRTMARLHGIPTGTPECIAALPLRLAQDWRLRGNFVELLHELQRKDSEFALHDALAVLLLAIGGPNASPNRSRLLDEPINLTAGFLASIGGWPGPDEDPVTDLDHPSDLDPRLNPLYAADAEPPPEPADASSEQAEAQNADTASDEDEEPARPEPPAGVSLAEITQALARLERGSVDLRLHLDSIDQRLSRMEPLLESPALTQPDAAAGTPAQSSAVVPPAIPRPAEVIVDQPRPTQPPASNSMSPATQPAAPAPQPSASRTHTQTSAPAPERNPQRDLVHRSDPPPAITPTPLPFSGPVDPPPGTPTASLDSAALPQIRPLTPRRDRFAAAMDLSGTRSALNLREREEAFHFAPTDSPVAAPAPEAVNKLLRDSEATSPPEASAPDMPVEPSPLHAATTSAPEVHPAFPESTFPDAQTFPSSSVPAESPASSASELSSDAPTTRAAAASVAPSQHPHTPVPPAILSALFALQTDASDVPPPRPAPAFTFAGAAPADLPSPSSGNPDKETPAAQTPVGATPEREIADGEVANGTGRGPLVLGLVAALIIAVAAFLLLRGKPIPFLVSQPRSTASADSPQMPAPRPAVTPSLNPPQPTSRSLTSPNKTSVARNPEPATRNPAPAPSTNDRVLSARQTAQPVAREQILETPTFVPEAAMKARLLSAPAPLYPKLANAVGLEGGVIFEAIIARDGSVEGLTVLGGQRLLRDAASNAVHQWRYQPFLLHGEPVEVRSIIHVNVVPPAAGEPADSQ